MNIRTEKNIRINRLIHNMMLKYLLLLFLILNCDLIKSQNIQRNFRQEAIQKAILDFSSIGRFYKDDSIFSVSFQDTIYKMVLKKTAGNVKWERSTLYTGMAVVTIIAYHNQFLLTNEIKVGTSGKLPSCYIEKNGRLFFWRDDDIALSGEALSVFLKYKLLRDNEKGKIEFPDLVTYDSQKGAFYYFCKGNVNHFKKVFTNKELGYYEPPKVKCFPK